MIASLPTEDLLYFGFRFSRHAAISSWPRGYRRRTGCAPERTWAFRRSASRRRISRRDADPQTRGLKSAFDQTLYNDLRYAGIFDVVSKSMIPQAMPGSPQEINLAQWAAEPANAAYVAFGAMSATGGHLTVQGFLYDTRSTQNPQVLGKQYGGEATADSARQIAHRFADEIIERLGGGSRGSRRRRFTTSARAAGTRKSG